MPRDSIGITFARRSKPEESAALDQLHDDFPTQVHVVHLVDNVGYGIGANTGINCLWQDGWFDYFCVSNDDVIPAVDCLPQLVRSTEELSDLARIAAVRDGRQLQDIRQLELLWARLRVLVQKLGEDLPRLRPIPVEEVLMALRDSLSSLAPGAQGRIERQVAEKIKGVRVGRPGHLAELSEVDPALIQRRHDCPPLLAITPPRLKLSCAAV